MVYDKVGELKEGGSEEKAEKEGREGRLQMEVVILEQSEVEEMGVRVKSKKGEEKEYRGIELMIDQRHPWQKCTNREGQQGAR